MSEDLAAHRRRLDRQFEAVRAFGAVPGTVIPKSDRHRLGIENVGPGDVFRLEGRPYRVEGKSEYREGAERWYELELFDLLAGEIVMLEWERDDEVEVCLNDRELSLEALGTTYAAVEAIADNERGQIKFGGLRFSYDDDYTCYFHRDGGAKAEKVFIIEFEDPEGEHCLAVEAWGEDDLEIQVWLGRYVEPDAIEVLASSGS